MVRDPSVSPSLTGCSLGGGHNNVGGDGGVTRLPRVRRPERWAWSEARWPAAMSASSVAGGLAADAMSASRRVVTAPARERLGGAREIFTRDYLRISLKIFRLLCNVV